ncbi:MAG TPA: phage portal protein, partial [Candidatus Saccharimonadales bacterium]|nr:phage portal protein [Candidatus Saccharimonadales bacterium]
AGQRGYDSIPKVIRTDEILHFVGLCHDGLKGLSVINAHRDTVGRDLAERRFGASYFGASARPGGVLKTDKTLDPPARKKLKEMWESGHQGPTQFHRTAILDGGLTYEPEKMSAADAQYVEQMQFSLQEIARIFGVPLVLLQSPEKGANYGGGIEQLMLMFSTFTLRPYMVSIEQELRRKLLPASAGTALFFKHDMKELLRADIKTRFEAHAAARQWGIASLNDVRREEDYPPIDEPWADQLMVPVNMTSADKLGQATAAPAPKGASSPLAPSSFPRAAVAPVLLRDLKLLVQREVKALRSALEKRTLAEFLEWLPDYYLTFEKFANDLCGESFAAASGETSAAWSAQLAEASLQEIRRSAEKSVNLSIDTKSAFQLLFEDWLEHKADRICDAVLQEGAAHGTRA